MSAFEILVPQCRVWKTSSGPKTSPCVFHSLSTLIGSRPTWTGWSRIGGMRISAPITTAIGKPSPCGHRTVTGPASSVAVARARRRCDYIGDVIESFPGRKNRVRFLKLRAGGHIFLHLDPSHTIETGIVRFHV